MNNWYKNLKTAPWNPPPYVFGIVWPILYIFLIISVSLVLFNKQCFPYCSPITYFILQMILNLSWTTIFFRYQQILLGLITIILMLGLAIVTMIQFYPINHLAAYLFIPYIVWLGVALSLNLYIFLYN
tara:strand:- start:447 stop:830 length:384 start_codon:yes stop_codon:yes gene_type:complete